MTNATFVNPTKFKPRDIFLNHVIKSYKINSKIISDNIKVDHDYIYGKENEQLEVTRMYMEIQQICEKLQNQSV